VADFWKNDETFNRRIENMSTKMTSREIPVQYDGFKVGEVTRFNKDTGEVTIKLDMSKWQTKLLKEMIINDIPISMSCKNEPCLQNKKMTREKTRFQHTPNAEKGEKMNLCCALEKGKTELKAIRRKDWPSNLAWYHGMDNQVCWWNSDSNSPCVHKTGDIVSFAVADFWKNDYELHPDVGYHGDLSLKSKIDCLEKDGDETNYVVHYKWQEGSELFFNRLLLKGFAIKDENDLTKLENGLLTVLSNCGMEEENLATVQITGITQL